MKKQDVAKQVKSAMKDYVISVELFRYAVARLLGINATDMQCLGILFHRRIATPSELSKHTGLGSGATTAMLDRLEHKGLIERQQNPQDGRGTHVVITQKTLDRITPLFGSFHKAEQKLVSSYSTQELELIYGFMNREVGVWDDAREGLSKPTDRFIVKLTRATGKR